MAAISAQGWDSPSDRGHKSPADQVGIGFQDHPGCREGSGSGGHKTDSRASNPSRVCPHPARCLSHRDVPVWTKTLCVRAGAGFRADPAQKMPTSVVCSLRDILVNNKRNQAQHNERAITLMNRYFDLLLVHADPQFQTLDETFPEVRELRCDVRYTGFVSQAVPQPLEAPSDRQASDQPMILVSIGGGRVGYELVECALQASAHLRTSFPHRMMILTGPYMPEEQFQQLRQSAEGRSRSSSNDIPPTFSLTYSRPPSQSAWPATIPA